MHGPLQAVAPLLALIADPQRRMKDEGNSFELDHRGHQYRLERKKGDWLISEGNTLIDRIPANLGEKPNADLVALAKQVINSHLQGKTPHGF
jgi:hypothetical protein